MKKFKYIFVHSDGKILFFFHLFPFFTEIRRNFIPKKDSKKTDIRTLAISLPGKNSADQEERNADFRSGKIFFAFL